MTKEDWEVIWNDEFVSGHQNIDRHHKLILEGISELYSMCTDSKKFEKEIPELTEKIEKALIEHMEIEINCLKKFNIEGVEEHKQSHKKYLDNIELYKKYNIPMTIKAILITEVAREYMNDHFFKFDKADIPQINKKLHNS